jgi:hypothetical protein
MSLAAQLGVHALLVHVPELPSSPHVFATEAG